jgi:hypothetical protein
VNYQQSDYRNQVIAEAIARLPNLGYDQASVSAGGQDRFQVVVIEWQIIAALELRQFAAGSEQGAQLRSPMHLHKPGRIAGWSFVKVENGLPGYAKLFKSDINSASRITRPVNDHLNVPVAKKIEVLPVGIEIAPTIISDNKTCRRGCCE